MHVACLCAWDGSSVYSIRTHAKHLRTSILFSLPSLSATGSNPSPLKSCSRSLDKMSDTDCSLSNQGAYAVPSRSFSCSAAGSYSSSVLVSSFSRASSASLLARDDSASLMAFANDKREVSRSFICEACSAAEGTVGGLVADMRDASNVRESAVGRAFRTEG